MDILTAGSEDLLVMSIIQVESGDSTAGGTLRATLAIHLQADTAVGHAGQSSRVARAPGELSRAVIRTTANTLAKEVCVVAGTSLLTGAVVRALE